MLQIDFNSQGGPIKRPQRANMSGPRLIPEGKIVRYKDYTFSGADGSLEEESKLPVMCRNPDGRRLANSRV